MEIIYENSDSRHCALSRAPPSAAHGYFDAKAAKQWKSTKSVALTFPGDWTAKAFETEIFAFLVHFAIFALRISPRDLRVLEIL